MISDSEIKTLGLDILSKNLGVVEAERFVALIQRDNFDYTKWRRNLLKEECGEEISKKAMEFQKKLKL
ncbi:MAG: hypothetical protein DWQ06_00680 [Calditrichaeota bacterium]|nr:MAG: hypothetical protein DWQ06_00680 [Calditrichota bacterium]